MAEVVIEIPKMLEDERSEMEHKLREVVKLEVRRKTISAFFDGLMKGAKQLSDEELVSLGRQIKKGRYEELKKKGLV